MSFWDGRLQTRGVRWWAVAALALLVAATFLVSFRKIHVDSDLTATIPGGAPALEASRRLLQRHPVVDRIAISLSREDGQTDPATLLQAADLVQARLEGSGLFATVGQDQTASALTELYPLVAERLPVLFTTAELERDVAPRLRPERIRQLLSEDLAELVELSGVGQTRVTAHDPLRLREPVLQRLARLAPSQNVRVEQNHLLSNDGKHLLLTAIPRRSAGDPVASAKLEGLFAELTELLRHPKAKPAPPAVAMRTAGAYRAAIDNERIIRRDTTRAVAFVCVGIALLLLLSFARPLLGLLALLPASAGVAGALLVYAVFSPSLSALALGFGAALVSIAVDQGIVFVAFLDREPGLGGRGAAREVFPAGFLSTLTTAGAFLALRLSGYPLLAQLGTFAALGMVLSFAFVQLVFPFLFRTDGGAPQRPLVDVDRMLSAVVRRSGRKTLLGVLVVGAACAVWSRPTFSTSLHGLSTVSPETRAAEEEIRSVWGNVFDHVYVMLEADTVDELQDQADQLQALLESERQTGTIVGGFTVSEIYPGPARAAHNAAAWRRFWNGDRQRKLRTELQRTGAELGFTADAFALFEQVVSKPAAASIPLSQRAHELVGISQARDGKGWVWLGTVGRGPHYDAAGFSARARALGAGVFDGRHFGATLGAFLERAFLRMLLVIGAFVVLSVALAFLDWRATLLALAPIVVGLVCTLSTLRLLGQSIDLPGLMLAIVIFGLGIDFSLHFLRSRQLRPADGESGQAPVRVAVLLAAGSTLLGMLSLAGAEHAALRSAGLGGSLGIAYSAIATFLILPPLQRRLFQGAPLAGVAGLSPAAIRQRIAGRFRPLAPRPRLYGFFKLRLDPMFEQLTELVGSARRLLDVGCGYGVPSAYLAAQHPELEILALEPDAARCNIARWVLAGRADVHQTRAADLPGAVEPYDTALLIDVAHYLDDQEWAAAAQAIHGQLEVGGRLLVRETIPGPGRPPWERASEALLVRLRGGHARFRSRQQISGVLEAVGFVVRTRPTAGREETWFIATKTTPTDAELAPDGALTSP